MASPPSFYLSLDETLKVCEKHGGHGKEAYLEKMGFGDSLKHATWDGEGFVDTGGWNSTGSLCETMFFAWAKHKVLVLTPEAVLAHMALGVAKWMCIAENANIVRHRFVDHEGQEVIGIAMDDPDDFVGFINAVGQKFEEQKKTNKLMQVITPEFSGTTALDVTVSRGIAMATFKKYYVYWMSVVCGLRGVVMEGTHEDWVLLSSKFRQLRALMPEMERWWKEMAEIISLFEATSALRVVAAAPTTTPKPIFSKIFSCFAKADDPTIVQKWKEMCSVPLMRMCGAGDEITGWLVQMDAFDRYGRMRPDLRAKRDDFSTGACVFTVFTDTTSFQVRTGFMGAKYEGPAGTQERIRPVTGLVVTHGAADGMTLAEQEMEWHANESFAVANDPEYIQARAAVEAWEHAHPFKDPYKKLDEQGEKEERVLHKQRCVLRENQYKTEAEAQARFRAAHPNPRKETE